MVISQIFVGSQDLVTWWKEGVRRERRKERMEGGREGEMEKGRERRKLYYDRKMKRGRQSLLWDFFKAQKEKQN